MCSYPGDLSQYPNGYSYSQLFALSESFPPGASWEGFREGIPYSFLSESFESGRVGFNNFSYDGTISDPRYSEPVAPAFGSALHWSSSGARQPHQHSLSLPHTDISRSYWNFDAPEKETLSECISPATHNLSPSLDMNSDATRPSLTNHLQPDYGTTTHYQNNATSPLFPQNASPSRSISPANNQPKRKSHHCPNCELLFARASDLQRHIDGIHLRIRHHCQVPGCGDNHGKGYCRLEKLKGHMLHVHGRY